MTRLVLVLTVLESSRPGCVSCLRMLVVSALRWAVHI
jgi:hypothetical protein